MSESQKYNPDSFVQKTFNWEGLRGFGESKIAALSMAGPFIGYAIIYNEAVHNFLNEVFNETLLASTPGTCEGWFSIIQRLNLLYIGIFLIGSGSILFRCFCPNLVRTHGNIFLYLENESQHVTARNLRSMFVTIRARRRSVSDQLLARAPWLDRGTDAGRAQESFEASGIPIRTDVMRSFYNVRSRYEKRFLVYVIYALYGAGFFLFGLPGLSFTYRVFCTIFS